MTERVGVDVGTEKRRLVQAVATARPKITPEPHGDRFSQPLTDSARYSGDVSCVRVVKQYFCPGLVRDFFGYFGKQIIKSVYCADLKEKIK